MKVESFKCNLLVDGHALEEHKVEVAGRAAKCYVESQTGKVSAAA